jgi:WD40 repeat protein
VASLFISHSSRDNALAATLRDRLEASGYAALFLDFDPERGIPVGRDWERELYAQLRSADGVVFLGSEHSLASQWCFAELALARSISKPIFPLLIDGAPLHPLLKDTQSISIAPGEDAAYARLVSDLVREGLDPRRSLSWDPTRPPYPGLASFEAADAGVFFGREREIDELFGRLHPTLERPAGRMIVLIGSSGSGKSSLLRAGVIPLLQRLLTSWVVVPPFVPGQSAIASFVHAVTEAFRARGDPRDVATDPGELVDALVSLRDGALGPNGSIVLAVDQAEELAPPRMALADRERFLALLAAALERIPRLWILATARSDLLAAALQQPGDPDLPIDVFPVKTLDRSSLPRVILGPAQRAGIDFDAGLVGRIVEDGAGGDALPLLAYTLQQLWERVGSAKRVSEEDYEAIGGVTGAVRGRADALMAELSRAGKAQLVIPTLLELTAIDASGEPTRRRVPASEFATEQREMIDGFVRARLLRSDSADGEEVVEVAHEALLRAWPPLRAAIDSAREQLQLRTALAPLAEEWDGEGRPEAYLLRGERLDRVRELDATDAGTELDNLERAFVSASVALADRERWRRRAVIVALSVLVVAIAVSGAAAVAFGVRAGRDRNAARSRQFAAQAIAQVAVDPQNSVALAVRAADYDHNADVEDALRQSLAAAHERAVLHGGGAITKAAFGKGGRFIVTSGPERTALVWESGSGRRVATLGPPHPLSVEGAQGTLGAAFAAGDSLVLRAAADGSVRVWRFPSGRHVSTFAPSRAFVRAADFTPDGRLAVTVEADAPIARVSTQDGTLRCLLKGPPPDLGSSSFAAIAFDSAGRRVATASEDGTARVWSVSTCTSSAPFGVRRDGDPLNTVSFSPDGSRLVTGDASGRARVWLIRGHRLLRTVAGPPKGLVSVSFSPDGERIVAAGRDGVGRIWDVRTGRATLLVGHAAELTSASVSRDGRLVVTTSEDGTARVWTGTGEPVAVLRGHAGPVYSATFDRRGTQILTNSADGTDRVWRVPRRTLVLAPHAGEVKSVASNGDIVATGDEDGAVRLWDARTGTLVRLLGRFVAPVDRLEFSEDGKRLVAASSEDQGRVWEMPTGREIATLRDRDDFVADVAVSADGTAVVTGGHGIARVWFIDHEGSRAVKDLPGHAGMVESVAISPRRRLLVATGDDGGHVRLWDPRVPRNRLLGDLGSRIVRVVFTRDGSRLLAVSVDGMARTWNAQTGEALLEDDFGNNLTAVAFDSDGRRAVVAAAPSGDPLVRIIRVGGGELARLAGHTRPVVATEFSPDDKRVLTASDDGTARVWTVESGAGRGVVLSGHTGGLTTARFGPDGETVLTAGKDGTARVFSCQFCGSLDELVRLAHDRLRD